MKKEAIIWKQTRRVIWESLEKEIRWEKCCNNINNLKNKRNNVFKDVGLLNPLKMLRWYFERGAGPQRLLSAPVGHWHGMLAWSLKGPSLSLLHSSRVSVCSLPYYPTGGKTVRSSKATTPDTGSSYYEWQCFPSSVFRRDFICAGEELTSKCSP